MKLFETPLAGAYVVEIEPVNDERGFFARTWCQREFQDLGLVAGFVQCSISFNHERSTLRGMHYQESPDQEAKLIRCTQGAIYDVIADLRKESPSFRQWFAVELNAVNRQSLYVPPGVAHGFQTLVDSCEVLYHISEFYRGASARGVRWNDPAFAIEWPQPPTVISERDRSYPDFRE